MRTPWRAGAVSERCVAGEEIDPFLAMAGWLHVGLRREARRTYLQTASSGSGIDARALAAGSSGLLAPRTGPMLSSIEAHAVAAWCEAGAAARRGEVHRRRGPGPPRRVSPLLHPPQKNRHKPPARAQRLLESGKHPVGQGGPPRRCPGHVSIASLIKAVCSGAAHQNRTVQEPTDVLSTSSPKK